MERFIKLIDEITALHAELAEKTARVAELEEKLKAAEKTINNQACVLEGIKLLYQDYRR